MNTNQYTQKTLEALQAAQQLAVEYQHNAMEPEHLLHALATQEQGLIPQLLQKLNVDAGSFSAAVAEAMDLAPTQEQIDTYSAYTEAYGANYCTMIALMDTVTDALTTGAQVK